MAVRKSTELAAVTAVVLALLIVCFGGLAIAALTDMAPVRVAAGGALGWAALYVLLSFAAFQLDGIFIGATRTREMRNASFFSVIAFMLAWWWLTPLFGNAGLWCAFVIYVCARALALAVYYPRLLRQLD
jgi:MATE family multidrug resistance protein